MVNDQQVRKLMIEKNAGKTIETASMKAGMSVPTARKYLKTGGLIPEPVDRNWKTRKVIWLLRFTPLIRYCLELFSLRIDQMWLIRIFLQQ